MGPDERVRTLAESYGLRGWGENWRYQFAASPHWQRRPRDHIWGSTASTIDNVKLNGRLGRMTPLLRWVIVGRYKSFEGRTFDDGSNGGKCIIHMPFPAIASAAAAGAHAWQPRRTLLFFAGAVDGVCCVGARAFFRR